jgi:hypothetical protein
MAVQHYFFWFLEWYDPREGIDVVEDVWSKEQFDKVSLLPCTPRKLMIGKWRGRKGNPSNH